MTADLGRIVILIIAAPIGSALLAFLLVGGFGGVAQWWDDLTKHQPHE